MFVLCLDETDKIKKEAFQLKLNEYTMRAEELKAILYISKVKVSDDKPRNKCSTPINDDESSPTLCKLSFYRY